MFCNEDQIYTCLHAKNAPSKTSALQGTPPHFFLVLLATLPNTCYELLPQSAIMKSIPEGEREASTAYRMNNCHHVHCVHWRRLRGTVPQSLR